MLPPLNDSRNLRLFLGGFLSHSVRSEIHGFCVFPSCAAILPCILYVHCKDLGPSRVRRDAVSLPNRLDLSGAIYVTYVQLIHIISLTKDPFHK